LQIRRDLKYVRRLATIIVYSAKVYNRNLRIRNFSWEIISVADPGCLSRIPDPDFYPSRISIPDPKIATKERCEKNCCHTFFCSHKFHKIENNFIFEMLNEKIKFVTKLSTIRYGFGIRDPGSRKKSIPDPGKKAPDPGSATVEIRIRIWKDL
jgi:hypothetical protein